MDNTDDLRLLLASRHPLLLVETDEEDRLLEVLRRAAASLDMAVWKWSAITGLARDHHGTMYQTRAADRALEFIAHVTAPAVFVFVDVHPYLTDPLVVRAAKETASRLREGQTIILTGPALDTPPELAALAHRWSLQRPTADELRELVGRTFRDLSGRGFKIAIDPGHFEDVVQTLLGLTRHEAERLLLRTALADDAVGPEDIPLLRRAKAELLADDGVLELIESPTMDLDDVGGVEGLKDWLRIRRLGRTERGDAAGLDPPRGILLTGVPGCGKSLVAKAVARSWGMPLVLLDPGRLYSKYVGESEQRLRAALEAIDAMAPAVLWIDEIEKGFSSSGDGDGGVGRRVLGSFLRWMQDRTSDVFVVATANDVRSLPPEFLRKGRFDEVFFVDLPDEKARLAIIGGHLDRRGLDPERFGLAALAAASEGFSGAELETAIVGAMYRAVAADSEVDDAAIIEEIATTVPLSRARSEQIDALRRWAAERAVHA